MVTHRRSMPVESATYGWLAPTPPVNANRIESGRSYRALANRDCRFAAIACAATSVRAPIESDTATDSMGYEPRAAEK
jgi:hypothetical protein